VVVAEREEGRGEEWRRSSLLFGYELMSLFAAQSRAMMILFLSRVYIAF